MIEAKYYDVIKCKKLNKHIKNEKEWKRIDIDKLC